MAKNKESPKGMLQVILSEGLQNNDHNLSIGAA
jgi:hypothetical protein